MKRDCKTPSGPICARAEDGFFENELSFNLIEWAVKVAVRFPCDRLVVVADSSVNESCVIACT